MLFPSKYTVLSSGCGAAHVGPTDVVSTPANMRQEPLPPPHPRHVKDDSVLRGSDAVRFCLKHGIDMSHVEGKIVEYFDPETAKTTKLVFIDGRQARQIARLRTCETVRPSHGFEVLRARVVVWEHPNEVGERLGEADVNHD